MESSTASVTASFCQTLVAAIWVSHCIVIVFSVKEPMNSFTRPKTTVIYTGTTNPNDRVFAFNDYSTASCRLKRTTASSSPAASFRPIARKLPVPAKKQHGCGYGGYSLGRGKSGDRRVHASLQEIAIRAVGNRRFTGSQRYTCLSRPRPVPAASWTVHVHPASTVLRSGTPTGSA